MDVNFIFVIAVLILSVVVHEVSHGYVADALGDPTARLAGRLTLNPIRHLDPVGSVLVPALLALVPGGLIFGWAKPVPYNPYNLRYSRYDEALVAAAGPASNVLIALAFALLIRAGIASSLITGPIVEILAMIVFVNIVLAIFNLVPVPPLDGSKILFTFLPARFANVRYALERYGLIFVFIFIVFLWQLIVPIVSVIFQFITGLPLS